MFRTLHQHNAVLYLIFYSTWKVYAYQSISLKALWQNANNYVLWKMSLLWKLYMVQLLNCYRLSSNYFLLNKIIRVLLIYIWAHFSTLYLNIRLNITINSIDLDCSQMKIEVNNLPSLFYRERERERTQLTKNKKFCDMRNFTCQEISIYKFNIIIHININITYVYIIDIV